MDSYFNHAIIGNGNVLGCFNKKGLLQRLYWPDIDYFQQVEFLRVGISFDHMGWDTLWCDNDDFLSEQQYEDNTAILITNLKNDKLGLELELRDSVLWDEDLYYRGIKVTNHGPYDTVLSIILHYKMKSSTDSICGSFYDNKENSIYFTRRNNYITIKTTDKDNLKRENVIIGSSLEEMANTKTFNIIDNASMGNEAVIKIDLGLFKSNEVKDKVLLHSFSHELSDSIDIVNKYKEYSTEALNKEVRSYWKGFFDSCKQISLKDMHNWRELEKIYKSSLMTFKLLTNKNTGAMIAAPEMDEEHRKCGGYGYCWCRDAGFIASAMAQCNMLEEVEEFYLWASSVQHMDGYWFQRYYTSGDVAPSWGLQIDETGTILWGVLNYYNLTKKEDFLKQMWPTVKKAANFLLEFKDEYTSLPHLSFDLWEERLGEHAYSAAAVCAGLRAAVKIANILELNDEDAQNWALYSEVINTKIKDIFWDDYNKILARSYKVKLNGFGKEPTCDVLQATMLGETREFEVTRIDRTCDISLLGLSIPFNIFSPKDEVLKLTAMRIESTLKLGHGYKRYENDNYADGNPWVISTLWLALYYIEIEEYQKAKDLLDICTKTASELGFLPEQFEYNSLNPAWILPLNWSHAMFVLVLFRLIDRGLL